MRQNYKTIYFADYPADSSQHRNLTLAIGSKDHEIYEHIRTLSSYELRELIGHNTFCSLQQAAEQEELAINTYCLRMLRQKERVAGAAPTQLSYINTADSNSDLFEPIQATFKGGETEPLHNWYPYLEGYSPQFVEQAIRRYAPHAQAVLDPFSGAGTTPLTAAKLGMKAYYCELNPLLQYLTDVKSFALTASDTTREHLATQLNVLADHIDEFIAEVQCDTGLHKSYQETFGNSVFFDRDVYEQILRVRAAIDLLACTEPITARFVTVAVLSSLIPASRLIRRGDVRYKTEKELQQRHIEFQLAVRGQLVLIAADLERITTMSEHPILVSEDAHNLGAIPSLGIDAVITSPPYLNGTNYFRNTKVELWFLRCLHSVDDLSALRFKAVTAGINDVTISKTYGNIDEHIRDLVAQLEQHAYDARIPRMVASYFADMRVILGSLRHHLNDNAAVLIDIGDSAYSGVHVATDKLLTELLVSLGFTPDREITLRRRMSRDGSTLRQVLLTFHYTAPKSQTQARLDRQVPAWESNWIAFKANLPHQQAEFAKRNWGHPLHSLCSYQGKMKPSLAFNLVKTFVPEGGSLLDPFAGVGTVPFEAALQGKLAWGFEISPAAIPIASAKVGRPTDETCLNLLRDIEAFIQSHTVTRDEVASAQSIHFNGPLLTYFHPQTFNEILLARRFFLEQPPRSPSEALVFSSLLHILHGNRPYALSRRSHPITPFAPTGSFDYRALMPRLRNKVNRSLAVVYPSNFREGTIMFQDATSWWPQHIQDLDAVLTSPPFFDSTRFYLANWMRLWFSGWEWHDFHSRPLSFVDERQKGSFAIYEPIFRQARERLKPGGVVVLHLGKSQKCDMAQELARIAAPWFKVIDTFHESVDHCESHGIPDKGAVKEHSYLVLQ